MTCRKGREKEREERRRGKRRGGKRKGEGREKGREGGAKRDSHGPPSTLVCHIVEACNGPPVIHLSQ